MIDAEEGGLITDLSDGVGVFKDLVAKRWSGRVAVGS
jgi:hypothetical protein